MNYEFPIITNINDILPIIEGKDEFFVSEREFFTVINYRIQDSKTFPSLHKCNGCNINLDGGDRCMSSKMIPCRKKRDGISLDREASVLRECRGIKFCSKTGNILSRPYQKFFNVQEKYETFLENIDFSKPHIVLEKLDGSMIHNLCHDGKIEWLTKMGAEDFNNSVSEFVKNRKNYEDFVWHLHNQGYTIIFEWCSSSIEQRIVITHKEDNLILTAIRSNLSGKYMNYPEMVKLAKIYDIPIVPAVEVDFINNPQGSINEIRKWEGREGVVIRFDDEMIKIKGDQYVSIHKNKDLISSEKAVAELIVNNGIDDVKPFLLPDDLETVNEYEDALVERIKILGESLYNWITKYESLTRKDFAITYSINFKPLMKAMIFHVWDNHSKEICNETVLSYFKKNCNNNKNFKVLKEQFFEDLKYGIKEIQE